MLIRLLETLARVMAVEPHLGRRAELLGHTELVLSAGHLGIEAPADIAALEARYVALFAADLPLRKAHR